MISNPQDIITPQYTITTHGYLRCRCNMCYDENNEQVRLLTGPHDLHCLCFSCLSNPLSDYQNDQAFAARYPGDYEPWVPEDTEIFDFTQAQVNQIIADFINEPPSISPTNQEMHASNGNIERFRHHINNPASRFYAGALSQAGLLSGGLLYSSMSNMAKPLSELREQVFGGPSNKEMHSYNGNLFSVGTRLSDNVKVPNKKDKNHYDGPLSGISSSHKLSDHIDVRRTKNARLPDKSALPGYKPPIKKLRDIIRPVVNKPPNKNLRDIINQPPLINNSTPYWNKVQFQGPKQQVSVPKLRNHMPVNDAFYQNPTQPSPTNKSMHSYNGNVKIKVKKYRKPKFKPKVKVKTKTIVKKQLAPKEKEEKRIAVKYANFLKNPVIMPPRLGSTGRMPTKMLHGFYEATFSMASMTLGGAAITNSTEFLVFISPAAIVNYSSVTAYASPITICANASSSSNFAAATNLLTANFSNSAQLINETGISSSTAGQPPGRYLGGHVSITCRCPMSTTAPPYMFGGVLPANQSISLSYGNTADPSKQLSFLSTNSIRTLLSTEEVPGFEISSVYVPSTANDLSFTPDYFQYNDASHMPIRPIPYVGMSGCPTTATVTVRVSVYYEMLQTTLNAAYGGWSLGPKLSAEDVFDHLPNIKMIKPRALALGSKTVSNVGGAVAMQLQQLFQPQKPNIQLSLKDLVHQQSLLSNRIAQLSLIIEDEEEKYITTSPLDTPKQNVNLTQSTIDLALAIKDRLTPGSVTSKTTRYTPL